LFLPQKWNKGRAEATQNTEKATPGGSQGRTIIP
jgi:hypothetical protein